MRGGGKKSSGEALRAACISRTRGCGATLLRRAEADGGAGPNASRLSQRLQRNMHEREMGDGVIQYSWDCSAAEKGWVMRQPRAGANSLV